MFPLLLKCIRMSISNNTVFIKFSSSEVTEKAAFDLLQLFCACCWHYYDLWSVTNCKHASHKQHAEQFNKCPALWIKDLTRWQIAIAKGTLNPVIVSQSCCPVIYSCCSATASVLEILMSHSLSQSCSVIENDSPSVIVLVLCVKERDRETGQKVEGKWGR